MINFVIASWLLCFYHCVQVRTLLEYILYLLRLSIMLVASLLCCLYHMSYFVYSFGLSDPCIVSVPVCTIFFISR